MQGNESMSGELLPLLPEFILLLGAVATLLSGSFLPRERQWMARIIAGSALVAAGVAAGFGLSSGDSTAFDMTYAVDLSTGVVRLVVVGATLLVIGLGTDELSGSPRESETYALLLLGALGAIVLGGADDLLVLAVGFLLASIPLYALIGMSRTAISAEAALKTYLLGALLGILMLAGITVLGAVGGSTRYADLTGGLTGVGSGVVAVGGVAVVGGLMFKAGGVPAHFWVPDAAQGAGVTAAAFATTVPKIGALIALYRLVETVPDAVHLRLLVALIAALSMSLGNLAAFYQQDPRRLLGWSTVSQVGYLLVPVAAAGSSELALPSLLVYLVAYAISNLSAFAVTAALPERRSLADYRGLATSRPWLAGALLVSLLSLVGTPPTAVFAGKLTTFIAGWDGGLQWLVVVAVLNSVASLFYYLRWIVRAVARRSRGSASTPQSPKPWATATAVLGGSLVLAVGLAAGLILAGTIQS